MADYTHLSNLIQGEVIRIFERRPPAEWEAELEKLIIYLSDERQKVIIEKIRASQQLSMPLPEPDDETASQSAVEDD